MNPVHKRKREIKKSGFLFSNQWCWIFFDEENWVWCLGLWFSLREKDEMWWREMRRNLKVKNKGRKRKKKKKKIRKGKVRCWSAWGRESVLSNPHGPHRFAIIYELAIGMHCLFKITNQIAPKSHNFYFHKLSILIGLWTWSWNVSCFDILRVRSNLTVKTPLCWVITCSVEGINILKMKFIISFFRDMKYPLKINLSQV